MIQDSPSKIYHYAVPFSPSSSWLHEWYNPKFIQGVKVVRGLQAEWERYSHTVSSHHFEGPLVCWGDIIAACSGCDIIALDAVTGFSLYVLSGHTGDITSLAFSPDGTFLVSGSEDKTIKLWDIQTGGVVRTFCGHTKAVCSASISADCTTIASGSCDKTVCLWSVQTGVCYCIINGHSSVVNSVSFSPKNPQLLISASDDETVQQWDINGQKTGSFYGGSHVVFSPDGAYFVLWTISTSVATVWNSDSGAVVAELQECNPGLLWCCFSPNSKLLASSNFGDVHIWDLINPDPCIIETIKTHDHNTIAFSSSHIFICSNGLIRFYPINNSATTNPKPTQFTLAPHMLHPSSYMSITVQGKEHVAILTDLAGIVRTWDISTGICKSSFHTKAGPISLRDTWSIDGRLIFVWCTHQEVHIWNTGREKPLQTVDAISDFSTTSLKISGDGSKVFFQDYNYLQALSTWTGEVVGKVALDGPPSHKPLIVDGSRVWVCFENLQTQGWDFGTPGLGPVPLSDLPLSSDRYHLGFVDGTKGQNLGPSRIEDAVTRKEVFQLPKRYQKPTIAQWDGQYLVAGYRSGEVLILDFTHMIPQ